MKTVNKISDISLKGYSRIYAKCINKSKKGICFSFAGKDKFWFPKSKVICVLGNLRPMYYVEKWLLHS